jgi:small subunit ribosomal protein S7
MSRRKRAERRKINPDIRYNNVDVQSFINRIMKNGKKSVATTLVYDALDIMAERTGKDALELFQTALKNTKPIMEVKPRRVGGATYQVPMEVPAHRQFALATRWIIASARSRSGQSFSDKLAGELLDAANNAGSSVRRREETHRMAEANRAFSHFRV